MNEYDDLLRRLTREHPVTVHTDGGPAFVKVQGLLQQLRDEMFGGTDSDRGVPAGKARLPLNARALDMFTLIDRQISEVWGAAFKRVPTADRSETLLVEWAIYIGAETIVRYSVPETIKVWSDRFTENVERVIWAGVECTAINLLRRWVHEIEELFDPPQTAEITAACIQCGERKVRRPKDGDWVEQSALVFVRDRVTGDSLEARCLACSASWPPPMFLYLAEKIAENEKETPVNAS